MADMPNGIAKTVLWCADYWARTCERRGRTTQLELIKRKSCQCNVRILVSAALAFSFLMDYRGNYSENHKFKEILAQDISRAKGHWMVILSSGTSTEMNGQPGMEVRISFACLPTRIVSSIFAPAMVGFQA